MRREADGRHDPGGACSWHVLPRRRRASQLNYSSSSGRRGVHLPLLRPGRGLRLPRHQVLSVRPVLLEVAGNVVTSQALDPHYLQDPGWHGLVDPELLHRLHEPPVQLRRPIHLDLPLAMGVLARCRRRLLLAMALCRRRRIGVEPGRRRILRRHRAQHLIIPVLHHIFLILQQPLPILVLY
uniref:Uncharacterized protein n=1 Tax=Arundo donax TaxID=35708 RepID=A0A0A9E0F4_ARUDO